jgi:protein-tyrosine phosphatase
MIFFKSSNKNKKLDFTEIGVDMHSHLIPGVDDGAKDVADSIQIIQGLKGLGFTKLFTTPHTLQDIHPNTTKL